MKQEYLSDEKTKFVNRTDIAKIDCTTTATH